MYLALAGYDYAPSEACIDATGMYLKKIRDHRRLDPYDYKLSASVMTTRGDWQRLTVLKKRGNKNKYLTKYF